MILITQVLTLLVTILCVCFTAHVSLSVHAIQKVFKPLHFSSGGTTQYGSVVPNLTASKIIFTRLAGKDVPLTQQYEIIAKNISLQIT